MKKAIAFKAKQASKKEIAVTSKVCVDNGVAAQVRAFKSKKADKKEVSRPEGLIGIEQKTKICAANLNILKEHLNTLQQEIDAVKDKHFLAIIAAVDAYRCARDNLSDAISEKPELFAKPRTYVFHGIKVGMQKPVGKLVFADEDRSIDLIFKHFEFDFDVLVSTHCTLNKDALGRLSAADLKKIGGAVEDSTDQVVIKPVAGDVEKMASALLKPVAGDVEKMAK